MRIGADAEYSDPSAARAQLSDFAEDGALLVRADNHIAWRVTTGADVANLQATLSSVLGR
ncbi:hypothetical protein [Pseudonocardia broussonetiae]|uniref:Uncharacterized protein n=1 Tax=Pseudonocardia broussonetiae TaxID=2736640 RepID=A0A6M6JQZ0_9PSEU|nr:hypothetical protein [Pseudonocardia broussonetiae]QJY49606.1 hypothetical protein HOP40_30785 [Pseudonocardia broussonetiae]